MALAHVATQMSLALVQQPGAIMCPQHYVPAESRNQSLAQPPPSNFSSLMNQARTHVAQVMGYQLTPLPGSQLAPGQLFPTVPYMAHMQQGQAGPSSHPSAKNRFEDMGTVAGTLRVAPIRDDKMDIAGMDLYDDKYDDEQVGKQAGERTSKQRGKGKGPEHPHNR
jgi:hypothetical protein